MLSTFHDNLAHLNFFSLENLVYRGKVKIDLIKIPPKSAHNFLKQLRFFPGGSKTNKGSRIQIWTTCFLSGKKTYSTGLNRLLWFLLYNPFHFRFISSALYEKFSISLRTKDTTIIKLVVYLSLQLSLFDLLLVFKQ